MNTRERFLAIMGFEPVDRPLFWEFGYWVPTPRRWYEEGLPWVAGLPRHLGGDATLMGECLGIDWRNPYYDVDVNRTLGFDEPMYRIPINNLYCPPFAEQVLEETEQWLKVIDIDGQTVQTSKINGSRRHVEAPVRSRADYYGLREERLQPNLADRLPNDWPQVRGKLRQRAFPLMYGGMQGFLEPVMHLHSALSMVSSEHGQKTLPQ